jgi:hypothetical protein
MVGKPNCLTCAKLNISTAKLKHCWDEKRCHNRRSYQRNKSERNRKRSKAGSTDIISIDAPQIHHGILQLWREPREDAPLHAIGLEIKLGDDSIASIDPVHCAGWMPSQVHRYIEQISEFTNEKYQFKKFSSFIVLPPSKCSIKGCFREQ